MQHHPKQMHFIDGSHQDPKQLITNNICYTINGSFGKRLKEIVDVEECISSGILITTEIHRFLPHNNPAEYKAFPGEGSRYA